MLTLYPSVMLVVMCSLLPIKREIRVGIPRGLLYHEYPVFWVSFLESLGAKVILSPPTNPAIMEAGVRLSVDDACLPVKVFCGHVDTLADRVDFVFVPRVVSVHKREYTCPKLLGLPEMLSELMEGRKAVVLTATVNMYRSVASLIRASTEIAHALKRPRLYGLRALLRGLSQQNNAFKALQTGRPALQPAEGLRVGLLGHSYLLKDDTTNVRLPNHLRSLGVSQIVTEDQIDSKKARRYARNLPKPLFWSFEKHSLGAAYYLIHNRLVDGIIQVVSFGCGPDSLVASLIESEARKYRMPYLAVFVDEHSADTGVLTRLEAFVDLVIEKRAAS